MITLVLELTKTELMRKQNIAPVICPLRLKELLSDIIDVFQSIVQLYQIHKNHLKKLHVGLLIQL